MRTTKFTTMTNNHPSGTQNTVTQKQLKQLKSRFGRLLRPLAWKQSGPILKGKVSKEVDK